MSAVDVWNTYAEWTEADCLARIRLLQDQVSGGATGVTGTNGGANFVEGRKAKMEIWALRCRLATIRGEPQPPPPPSADLRRRTRVSWLRPTHDAGY